MNRCFVKVYQTPVASLLLVLAWHGIHGASGATVSLQPIKDNTLYEFDPADPDSPLNSNGAGDMFSAGRTRSRALLRRGLLQFDLTTIPAGAVVVPGTVALTLEVVDSPRRDTSGEARDFWLVPLEQEWGEGSSAANAGVSGSGSGAAATPGDATWLHTSYDPNLHDPRMPDLADPGYWSQTGVLGNSPVDPTAYGDPAGSVPAAPYLGPVTFASMTMESDLRRWLADPTSNFGWLVLGDERIAGEDVSSARGFASREHATPPTLSFEVTIVPEPSSVTIVLVGLVMFCWCDRSRRLERRSRRCERRWQ